MKSDTFDLTHARILVLGGTGLLGSAVCAELNNQFPSADICDPSRWELPLLESEAVFDYFSDSEPYDIVFNCAAKVGGIYANDKYPVDFFNENVLLQLNVFEACRLFHVKRLVLPGSSCMYPVNAPQPYHEHSLQLGEFEPTNAAYALAKMVGFEQAKYYQKQYGLFTVLPVFTNLYGAGDAYGDRSHVIPAMIAKLEEAKRSGQMIVQFSGNGQNWREFLYVQDAARACVQLARTKVTMTPINVGSGFETQICKLAEKIAQIVEYQGLIEWETTSHGSNRKLMDSSQIFSLGWRPRVSLVEGLCATYADYLQRYWSTGGGYKNAE